MIEVLNLSKNYRDKQVLRNIHLRLEEGKIYGIAGENGAGKTTLFRCMAGLENYKGQVVSDLQPLKNHLGLLPAEPYFFSRITGEEYIRFVCNARGKNISGIKDKNIFDLPLHQYVSTYSTGMKKKLAITAIFLQENRYFIFDEPFNGVDIQSNILISGIITRLKELRKNILLSSHIFSTLSEICDEIHLLKNGEIIRTVQKQGFVSLESEMKAMTIGDKIERLELK